MKLLTEGDLQNLAAGLVDGSGMTYQQIADHIGVKHRTLITHALSGKSKKTCHLIIEKLGGYRIGFQVDPPLFSPGPQK